MKLSIAGFRNHLVQSRGKGHGTAANYGQLAQNLVGVHPDGATYEQMQEFLGKQKGSHVTAASKAFSRWAESHGVIYALDPQADPAPIPLDSRHSTIWMLLLKFGGFQDVMDEDAGPNRIAALTWAGVPPLGDWCSVAMERLDPEARAGVDVVLANLRRLGRGSPLVFARSEGATRDHWNADELDNFSFGEGTQ